MKRLKSSKIGIRNKILTTLNLKSRSNTMKMLITEKDIPMIVGKFIVQLTEEKVIPTIKELFFREKRIFYVSKTWDDYILLNGAFYSHPPTTKTKFVEYFNDSGTKKINRYHRLLTKDELDWLLTCLKETNY